MNDFIETMLLGDGKWTVSYNTSGVAFVVDSVDAVVPTDNPDLYDKLVALLG